MVIVDTREQSNRFVTDYFEQNGIEYKREKIDTGDYKIEGQDDIVIERKQDLLELAGNICSKDHARFKRELLRAMESNIKVYIVIGDKKIRNIEEVAKWHSKHTLVKGETLMKAMKTIKERYGVEYIIDQECNIGSIIYNILTYKGVPRMEVRDNWIYFEKPKIHKKITGTKLPVLLDENPYKKKGEQVLEMLGIVKNKEIDPYYLVRGDIAEHLTKRFLEKMGFTCKTWEKKEINFDNFPMNEDFGGMIDIAITKPDRVVVEVKSKNIKDYNRISYYGNLYEERQGMLYATLCQTNVLLVWVFFNHATETIIRENQFKPIDDIIEMIDLDGRSGDGSKNVSIYTKFITVNQEEMQQKMQIAKEYYEECYNNCRVPIYDVSQDFLIENNLLSKDTKPF